MADPIVSVVIEKTADLLVAEAFFLIGVKEEVERLNALLERMNSFLKDADRKQDQDDGLQTRVRQIRKLAYDAEDVIDWYMLKVSHRRGFQGIIKRLPTIFTKPFHLHNIGNQIKAIRKQFQDISDTLPAFEISGEGSGRSTSAAEMQRQLRRSYPHVEEDDVVSLEVTTKDVMDQLMKGEDRLHAVSLVGMGGIGKTTLAKKVYNHNDVKRHFDCRAWVFISQQCLPREVFHGVLIKVMSPSGEEREQIDKLKEHELVEKLYDALKEKRYLVVLDDIWRHEDWDRLKPAFPKGIKGSKLLFTTRNRELPRLADPCSSPIELPLLTDNESWKLFRRKAFPEDKMETHACSKELELLGREMLEKCGGLPLAIAVLGGLLATKKSWKEWEMVQKNINAPFNRFQQQDDPHGGVNWILALSYKELPFHLKPCFLYLGHYPEDYEISKKEVIRLWIAEGFISSSLEGGELLMEDVAEQYLEELTNRCLVQVSRRDHTGTGVKTFHIHDLLRDLCVSKAREENFFSIVRAPMDGYGVPFLDAVARRIVVHPYKRYGFLKGKCPKLRSLLLFPREDLIMLDKVESSNFRFLRVLKLLNWTHERNIPSEIGNLFHLRYLGIICVEAILPQSLGKLKNLQTLFIQCNFPRKIPNALFKLERLRHLLLTKWCPFLYEHEGDTLENIETIKHITVEKLTENSSLLKLRKIRSLRIQFERSKDVGALLRSPTFGLGSLQSLHMEFERRVSIPSQELEPLSQCHHLSKLSLSGRIEEDPGSNNVLKFVPTNIFKLYLNCPGIKQDPMPVLEKLPQLRILRLNSSDADRMSCTADGFPKLDSLVIVDSRLAEWQIEEGAMPCLRSLRLSDLHHLERIPEGLRYVTTLQEMNLNGMRSLVERIKREDFYKVHHIPSIRWNNKLWQERQQHKCSK